VARRGNDLASEVHQGCSVRRGEFLPYLAQATIEVDGGRLVVGAKRLCTVQQRLIVTEALAHVSADYVSLCGRHRTIGPGSRQGELDSEIHQEYVSVIRHVVYPVRHGCM
jgi:hypothetical protein